MVFCWCAMTKDMHLEIELNRISNYRVKNKKHYSTVDTVCSYVPVQYETLIQSNEICFQNRSYITRWPTGGMKLEIKKFNQPKE